jgi:stage V sporulation protein S
MNRFFSKLDLRDIKIDPESARFPPDGDDDVDDASQEVELAPEPVAEVAPIDEVPPVDLASAAVPASENGHVTQETVELITAHQDGDEVLKVSARSRPSAVAGAIAGVVREFGHAEVQAIGAGATNQAVKAAAIARDYLLETGIDAVCLPAFIDVIIDNEERTAMRLVIEPR